MVSTRAKWSSAQARHVVESCPPENSTSAVASGLVIGPAQKRFQAKWAPVRVKKTRQNKKLEPRSDSIGTEKALAPTGDRANACMAGASTCFRWDGHLT